MCKGSSSTTTSSSSLPDWLESGYKSLLNLGTNAAQQPLQQYTGSQIAGFTPDQTSAFQLTEQAQGMGLPYVNTASDWLTQASQPVFPSVSQYSAANLQPYMDPYQQSVVDSTLANILKSDQIAQNDLVGKAISSGASPFSGDRAGVAAAELARNQGLARNQTIAQLMSQGFNNAQQQFNNQQQLQLSGLGQDAARLASNANSMAGLGQNAQNLTLSGANALLTTGGLQQELAQQQLNIPYQQFQQAQQYPYQQLDFLRGLVTGTGGQIPTSTTTTSPGPSPIAQLAGLGTAGLGMYQMFNQPTTTTTSNSGGGLGSLLGSALSLFGLRRGGRVPHKDSGGSVVGLAPIDVSEFRIPSSRWYQSAPTSPGLNTGQQTYINALPQIDWQSMPEPRKIELPQSLLDILKGMKFADGGLVGGGGRRASLGGLDTLSGLPLVYMGLGMMSSKNPSALGGIGEGALSGLKMAEESRANLDQGAQVLSDGATYRIMYPSTGEVYDTGVPVTRKPVTLTPGDTLVDQTTGKRIAGSDLGYDPSSVEKQLMSMGYKPNTPEWNAAMEKQLAKSNGTVINTGESATSKGIADRALGVMDEAQTATSKAQQYDELAYLLTRPGVYTGTFGPGIAAAKKAAKTLLGVDVGDVENPEVAKRIGSEVVGQIRKDIMSGATSDRDMVILSSIPPNITDTQEGILLTAEMAKAAAEGKAAQRQKLIDISSDPANIENGSLSLIGWNKFLQWVQDNPIFTQEKMSEIQDRARSRVVDRGPTAGAEKALQEKFPYLFSPAPSAPPPLGTDPSVFRRP